MARITLNTVVILLGYPDISGHPLMKRCIKVVCNTKPPKPMYIYAWDINKASLYIASTGCDEIISDKILSQKPIILYCSEWSSDKYTTVIFSATNDSR